MSQESNHPDISAAHSAVAEAAEADLNDRAALLEHAAAALERALADEGPVDSGPAPA